ncbi:hypothetical protein [Flavobacterium sp. UBA7682]|uniref:hypothetical protein n=1 Tax=Flavobacterium sp. UBA7682 TaxID=1946560 RepID=UPI0025C41780|nr:hypothetical protein [Flavobacterium sp. UBA7682]
MKKLFLASIALISSLACVGQNEQPTEKTEKTLNSNWSNIPKWNYIENGKQFVFVRKGIAKLETCNDGLNNFLNSYNATNNKKLMKINSNERANLLESAKKYYLGATILKSPNDTIGDYIKLIDIPETHKFTVIATTGIEPHYTILKSIRKDKPNPFDSSKMIIDYVYDSEVSYYSGNDESYKTKKQTKLLIQNLNTKLYYVLNLEAFEFSYGQCDNLSYKVLAQIYKTIPKTLSKNEQDLVNRYKSLIKSANTNVAVLLSIQKKNLTRGYFNPDKVNAADRKIYNKNLEELKAKAQKLAEIDRNEDKDDIAQDKLTTAELASLSSINDWNLKQTKI